MNIVYLLLPIAFIIFGLGLAAFIWAVRSGQFDDLDTPPIKIFEADDTTERKRNE